MKQHSKTLIAGGVLALVLIGMAMRGPLEDAKVMRLFRPLADQGNATAQNNLGVMYRDGSGVSRDYAQAFAWYRKAADLGNANAQSIGGLTKLRVPPALPGWQ